MFKRFTTGFAAGYVLGARAGQKRYEQIADIAEQAMKIPLVSDAVGRARDAMTADNGRHLLNGLKERWSGSDRPEEEDTEDDGEEEDRARARDESGDGEADDDDTREDDARDEDMDDVRDEDEDMDDDDGEDGDDNAEAAEDSKPRRRRAQSNGRRESRGRKPSSKIGELAAAAIERGRTD